MQQYWYKNQQKWQKKPNATPITAAARLTTITKTITATINKSKNVAKNLRLTRRSVDQIQSLIDLSQSIIPACAKS